MHWRGLAIGLSGGACLWTLAGALLFHSGEAAQVGGWLFVLCLVFMITAPDRVD